MSRRDRVAAHFKAFPNHWIDGLELATIGGAYAWRTRVSECRLDLGMTIQNEERKIGAVTRSFYRYVPSVEAPQTAPHDLNGFSLR